MEKISREQVAEAFEHSSSIRCDRGRRLKENGYTVGRQYHIEFFVDVDDKDVKVAEAYVDEISPKEDCLFDFLEDSVNGDYKALAVRLGFIPYIYDYLEEEKGHFPCNKHQRVFDKMMKTIDDCGDYIYYLRKLYVEPEYRGLGIGQKLLEDITYALSRYLCDDEIVLTLHASPIEINEKVEPKKHKEWKQKLIHFYRKCGFAHVGEGTCVKVAKVEYF